MEDKKVQKINRSLEGVNAGVREITQRFDDYLKSQSFATITTEIVGGGSDNAPTSQITTISCSALKGDIPKDSYFIISYPDGTHPKSIQNKKADKVAGDTSIVIHDGSTPDDQTIYADYPYPVGSLLSAVNYAGNDTQFAAGNNTEVQYNTSGQLSGDSSFTFDDSTNTLNATFIHCTEIGGGLTSTSYLNNGVTAITQNISDDSNKVATTAFVHDAIADEDYGVTKIIAGTNVTISPVDGTGDVTINSTGSGGGTPAGTDTQVQFNNAGAFGASSSLTFNDTTDKLTTYALSCADATITNLTVSAGGVLNSGSDIKTDTEFKGNNIGTISDDAIYLTPFDFTANSDAFARPYVFATGATAKIYSTADYLQAGFVVPVGYQATHIDLQAGYTGTVRSWSLTQFDWNTSTYGLHGSYDSNVNEEIYNHTKTVVTPLVGVAGRYWSISFDPQLSSDTIKGVKITLERI